MKKKTKKLKKISKKDLKKVKGGYIGGDPDKMDARWRHQYRRGNG